MLSPEQIAARLTGIGGSDASAAIGLNPYRSAVDLYLEKRGEVPAFAGNEATRWGQLLEPAIRQEYAERTGRVVRLPTDTQRHPVHSFMLAHPDGVTDDARLYEGKMARFPDGWGEPGSDQIPTPYLVQVQHNMLVLGLVVADVAVLIGGNDFRLYEVPADTELQDLIREREAAFWQCVQNGTRPAIDFEAPGALDLVKRLYPGTNGKRLIAPAELMTWREIYERATEKAASYQAVADGAKAHLAYEMGEAALLAFPDGIALRRKRTQRKGYTVEATEYLDIRFTKDKES